MRLVAAILVASCGGAPPAPQLRFSGDPTAPLPASADVSLSALVDGEIRVDGTWTTGRSVLAVTCEPACESDQRGAATVIVHPPGPGRLVVTALMGGEHQQVKVSRVYQVVIPDDIDVMCRDARGALGPCDVPQDAHAIAEVVAHAQGRLIERLAGMRVDGKEVSGAFYLSDVVDVKTPGQHVVEVAGGRMRKRTVISIAAP